MRLTVEIPRSIAEDNLRTVEVDATSIEGAIVAAGKLNKAFEPNVGNKFIVTARVEVLPRPSIPLGSW